MTSLIVVGTVQLLLSMKPYFTCLVKKCIITMKFIVEYTSERGKIGTTFIVLQ